MEIGIGVGLEAMFRGKLLWWERRFVRRMRVDVRKVAVNSVNSLENTPFKLKECVKWQEMCGIGAWTW